MSDNPGTYKISFNFLQRWSQRKRQATEKTESRIVTTETVSPDAKPAPEAAADSLPPLPAIDSLNENSEVGMFFSEGVSEAIKRQALRKLFHMDKFNICDGLDDYAEDYTVFQPLGKIITAYQRMSQEQEKSEQVAPDDVSDEKREQQPAPDPDSQVDGSLSANDQPDSGSAANERHKEV